jgi:choline dehydrogenase-like flavoprotein
MSAPTSKGEPTSPSSSLSRPPSRPPPPPPNMDWLAAARERVRVFAQYDRPFEEKADVVVVGSGPCGAVAAYELANAGHDVILVEEGPPFTVRDFELDGNLSMTRTMREGGLRMTRGTTMPTMQAVALGGGSLVNSAICVRPPDSVFDRWATKFDLERTDRENLDPHFDAITEFLGIAPTPDEVQGRRNLLFREGCDAMGIDSEPISRNVRGCRGSGECFTGCRSRAKQSMDVSYVPAALRAGARVFTSLQVQTIRHSGSRVSGISGQVVAPFGGPTTHRFRIEAKAVVLAAGCTASPVLLLRSDDLANRSGQVGENLQFHPGVAIAGVYPEAVDPQFGATQGYQSLAFLDEGFKLETLWAPPPLLSMRFPGLGPELQAHFADLPQTAVWDAIVSANESLGRVRPGRGFGRRGQDPILEWRIDPRDVAILRRALHVIAQLHFAAGARKILPGVQGVAEVMTSADEARILDSHQVTPSSLVMGGNHVFCTTRMHGDPTRGVVDEDGRCHDLENLYIADTGIFPQCPSVNPMLTGMALARRQALVLAERL